jgi:ribosomal-protein-serine acetyltransferase
MFNYRINKEIELRLLEERHAEEFYALLMDNREYFRQWLSWNLDENYTIEKTKDFIKGSLQRYANNNGFEAGIWSQGKLVGEIGFDSIDWWNRKTTIGYSLGASFQGKGLVTSACRVLINYAFHELKLNRVELRIASDNKRSRAVAERLGFTAEGILQQAEWLHDHFVDHMVYRMLASEWEVANKEP